MNARMNEGNTLSPIEIGVAPGGEGRAVMPYRVQIGQGLLDRIGEIVSEVTRASRIALISDETVVPLYGARVLESLRAAGLPAECFTVPSGEAHKTRESWASLSDRMLARRFGRDSAVIALGGGVIGDLGGFVAATYMRGLPLVQVPTTLLAMVDSSVGGKTGVDTPAGKNLIGSFHQPAAVVADTDALRTLPPREVRSGLAEVVKAGAIADAELFGQLEALGAALGSPDPGSLAPIIARAIEIKAAVVAADERELGLRKTLNFGHTAGHAIEAHSGFALLHGEAIAVGMVVEARIGETLGITEPGTAGRLERVLEAIDLPTRVPEGYDRRAILELTLVDKKARAGRAEYSLIERIGIAHPAGGRYAVPVDDGAAVAALG
jgi:3-dehydroquinate synthase